ncbi:hypothetical protein B0H16DRAFT_1716240 [Mycena metata]|uniref:Uncharacterized protein n=1 Tax=Mycena metata TaxID=1033252 RepID=A0AAD7JNW7_9AGAR|nr:hypothetical protein B0H16DRAFT_1716240 [Mycena metata]
MTPKGRAAATDPSTPLPAHDDSRTSRQSVTEKGNTVLTSPCEIEADRSNVTSRIGSRRARAVPPLPANAHVLWEPRSAASLSSRSVSPSLPHRPAPQLQVHGSPDDSFAPSASATASKPPNKKKKKSKPRDTAKQQKFSTFRALAEDEDQTNTLDGLAQLLGDVIKTMKAYTGTLIVACYNTLDAIAMRLGNHLTFPQAGDEREALGAVVSRTVLAPVKELTAKVELQQEAIISLTKSVEAPVAVT